MARRRKAPRRKRHYRLGADEMSLPNDPGLKDRIIASEKASSEQFSLVLGFGLVLIVVVAAALAPSKT